MREITLLPRVTGSDRIISMREKLKTVNRPQDDSYLVGSDSISSCSLEDLLTAFSVEMPSLIPPEKLAVYKTYLGEDNVDWSLALGSKGLASELRRYRDELVEIVEDIESTGYVDTLIRGRKIFEMLSPIRVDAVKVRSLIDAGEQLSSFTPSVFGECDPIRYTHGTKTGRLRVESGPKVLTMSKAHRNIVTSRYPGGKIMSVDFISLEPRLALFTVGKTSTGDIYEEISRESGESRAKTKIATLSFLYGAAASDLVSDRLRRTVREYFNVQELHSRIVDCNGKNGYGRPLHVEEERLLIPHWVQSTAVDVCLLAFSELAEKLIGIADPLFLVHDAMFLDVPSASTAKLAEIISLGLIVSPYGLFHLSLNGTESNE